MPDSSAFIGALALIATGALTYLGVRHTTRASREANKDTVSQAEQTTAVQALESMTLNLLQPYRDEVDRLRGEIANDRNAQAKRDAADKAERERKAREVQEQLTRQRERIDLLAVEVKHWKSMAKAIARWATTLRDQVLALGGSVPTLPDELLVAQLLDEDGDEL